MRETMKKALFTTTALTALLSSASFAAAEMTVTGYAEMGIVGGDRYEGNRTTIRDTSDVGGGRIVNSAQRDKLILDGDRDESDFSVEELSTNDQPRFFQDFTITFDGTGETDNGVTFGFHVELEESNTPFYPNGSLGLGDIITAGSGDYQATGDGGAAYDNESVFISGAFGTLTLGEIDGAYDKRLTEVALAGGTIADDETTHAGFDGNSGLDDAYDNQILRYDYDFGEFGFSVSLEQDDVKSCTYAYGSAGSCNPELGSDVWGLGASYDADWGGMAWNFGLGYQTSDDIGDIWGVSAVGGFGAFQAAVNYSSFDGENGFPDYDHWGLGAAYTLDAWTFAANWGEFDIDAGDSDRNGYGLLVNYDLGGGAVIEAGWGHSDYDAAGLKDQDQYSFGLALSF